LHGTELLSPDDKEFLKGKTGLCPVCGREMMLGYEELRRAIPKCPICRGAKNLSRAMTALETILPTVSETEKKEE
jgi:Zn-finger nucleic acid-binding protein